MTKARDTGEVLNTRGTAATADVGTAPTEVPTNADLGSSSLLDTGTAAGEVPTNNDLGSASLVDTGTGAANVPTNDDLGTAAYDDVQTSPSDTTAGALLNNETTHIGGDVNYTGANYQPEQTLSGLGVVRLMKNVSGSTFNSGQQMTGDNLRDAYFYASGSPQGGVRGNALHIYKNITGANVKSGGFAQVVRIS